MAEERLTRRGLNRALLGRQMLLAREPVSALEAIRRLVGLQAQQARPPFVGLWSRISGFEREELQALIEGREVVRATLMRCTIHLMTREDYVAFRPALQPALSQAMNGILGERAGTFELEAVVEEARRLFGERPRTFAELRADLVKRFPAADERAMGYAVRTQLPLVIVPEPHPWGFRADGKFALAEEWLEQPVEREGGPHALVLRYLRAFGPASVRDTQAWSGLPGLAPVLEDLRPQLRVFRDERGRELFDLPEAPRPSEETHAPARFVADFDNLVLSHADRTRVISDEHRAVVITKNAQVLPTILVDGFVAGTWKCARVRKTAVVTVSPFGTLTSRAMEELEAEAEGLARLLEPGADRCELRFGEA